MATIRTRLSARDAGRALTWDDFAASECAEGHRYALIGGRLDVSPYPNLPHEVVRKWLERQLDDYAARRPEVVNWTQSPARVFLPGQTVQTVPEPDLAAYRDFPLDRAVGDVQWSDVSPVLVAEVVSEDTAEKDLDRNPALYLAVPTIQEYWILDPRDDAERPALVVHRRRWRRTLHVPPGGGYQTDLLPGFTLTLGVTLSRG